MLVEPVPWNRTAALAVAGGRYTGNPLSQLLEDLSSWFPTGNDYGGGDHPFYGTPPVRVREMVPYIIPGYVEVPPGPNDPLDCW